jgi:hypothetical protein
MTEDDIKALCYAAEITTLKQRIEQLEAALQGLIEANENNWHPMKVNGAEWFTARAALGDKIKKPSFKWRALVKDDRTDSGRYEISVALVDMESEQTPHHVKSWGWDDFNEKIIFPSTSSNAKDDVIWNKMINTAHAFAALLNMRDGYEQ